MTSAQHVNVHDAAGLWQLGACGHISIARVLASYAESAGFNSQHSIKSGSEVHTSKPGTWDLAE